MLKELICAVLAIMIVFSAFPAAGAALDEEYKTVDWYYDLSDPDINREYSRRFHAIWGNSGNVNREEVKKFLNLLEEICDYYVNELKFNEPTQVVYGDENADKTKYKVCVYITQTGLSQHQSGYAYQGTKWLDNGMIGYIAVEYAAFTNSYVIAHEFAHVCQLHSGGGFANNNPTSGPFWEMYADYMSGKFHHRENGTTLSANTLSYNHLYFPHGKNYYNCWLLAAYFDENPQIVGEYFNSRFWKESIQDEFPFDTIKRLLPESADFKDVLGDYARRAAVLDFQMRDKYIQLKNEWIQNGTMDTRYIYPELERVPDKEGFWRVPLEYAPMQGGFNAIRLLPEDNKVAVELYGVKHMNDSNQDFRASLVIVDNANKKINYSPLFSEGEMSIDIPPNAGEVYLVVCATPDEFYPVCTFDVTEATQYNIDRAKQRYLYEVKIKGAQPYETKEPIKGEKIHPNGGGRVADTAYVAPTAYVAKNAQVLDNARVLGNARILDYAVVSGNAVVKDNAVVSGHARVLRNALVEGNAKVRDYATVTDNVVVSGNAKVMEHAKISGQAIIRDNGVARGSAEFGGKTEVFGFGMMDGDYIGDNLKVSNTVAFGRTPSQDFINRRPEVTQNLFSEFLFYKEHDYAIDSFSSSIGIFRGNIPYIDYDDGKSGIVKLDEGSYILFGSEISDFKDVIYEISLKWTGGDNERLITLGAPEAYVYFSPSKGGRAAFGLIKDGVETALYADREILKNTWTNIKIKINQGNVQIFENGEEILNGKLDFTLDSLRNDGGNGEVKTLNKLGGDFKGFVDSFLVYSDSAYGEIKPKEYRFTGEEIEDYNNAEIVEGLYGRAVSLDGNESYVRLPVGITYGVRDFTISVFVKPHTLDRWARVFDIGYDTGNYAMLTAADGDNKLRFEIYAGGKYSLIAQEPLKAGVWQHVLITKQGSAIKMFVDGQLAARRDDFNISLSEIGYSTVNYLGKSKYKDPYFNGQIDEFEILPFALSDEEAANYKPFLEIEKEVYSGFVNVKIKNPTLRDKKLTIFINQLDEDGKLIKTNIKGAKIKKGKDFSAQIPYTKEENCKIVSVSVIEN